MRQRKDNMEVRDRKKFTLPCVQPVLPGLRLTLRAMPVAAAVVRNGLMMARRAGIDMTSERRSPAAGNRRKSAQLLVAEPRLVFLQKSITMLADNVGHLEGGPGHSGFRSRRERGTSATCFVPRLSGSFEQPSRCFLDRCRYREVVSRSSWPAIPEVSSDPCRLRVDELPSCVEANAVTRVW